MSEYFQIVKVRCMISKAIFDAHLTYFELIENKQNESSVRFTLSLINASKAGDRQLSRA